MADGCNLYLTRGDLEKIEKSLDDKSRERVCDVVETAFKGNTLALAKKVSYPLSNPQDPAHKVFRDYVLCNVAGNQSIPDDYKSHLSNAVSRIAKHTPDIVGLVRPATRSGRGATSWDKTIAHRKQGAAYAYEVLQTARLLDHGSRSSNGGKELKIDDSDRIDLGVKLQARYAGTEDIFPQKVKRGTVEADTFIQRGDQAPIGIDFKHSTGAKEYSSISADQIAGIKVAIASGEISEFNFVTNGYFSDPIKEKIKEANKELSNGNHPNITIAIHEKRGATT